MRFQLELFCPRLSRIFKTKFQQKKIIEIGFRRKRYRVFRQRVLFVLSSWHLVFGLEKLSSFNCSYFASMLKMNFLHENRIRRFIWFVFRMNERCCSSVLDFVLLVYVIPVSARHPTQIVLASVCERKRGRKSVCSNFSMTMCESILPIQNTYNSIWNTFKLCMCI